MHLIRPDVSSLHRLGGTGDRGVDIAFVDQRSRLRRIGAQCGLDVLQIRQCRRRLPAHFELGRGPDGIFLPLGDNTDEVADGHDRNHPGNIPHRGFVDRDQAGADKRAGVDSRIGWPDHAAVQHAGHAHVMDVDQFAGGLGREVDARHRLSDDGVGADILHRDVIGQFKPDGIT